MEDFGCRVSVYDPWADSEEVRHEYGIDLLPELSPAYDESYDVLIAAVDHDAFRKLEPRALVAPDGIVFDVKGVFPKDKTDGRL